MYSPPIHLQCSVFLNLIILAWTVLKFCGLSSLGVLRRGVLRRPILLCCPPVAPPLQLTVNRRLSIWGVNLVTRILIRLIQPLTLRRLTQPRLTQPLNTAHSASAAGPCPAASIRLTQPPQQGPAQLPYTHIHTALSCHSLGAWQSN